MYASTEGIRGEGRSIAAYGGIRIEDDVVCTDSKPENLTRDAFALLD